MGQKLEKKIALYCRTSTDKQEKGLEAQRRTLLEVVAREELGDFILFEDEGISGTKDHRPGVDALMAACRAGEVHTVFVYSFTRFGRSTRHLINTCFEFEKLGIAFRSHTEKIDTTSSMGKFFFTILAAFAQFERDVTAERVKNGLRNAVAKGKKLGRPPRARKKKRLIVDMFKAGVKVQEIADHLRISVRSVYRIIAKNLKKEGL